MRQSAAHSQNPLDQRSQWCCRRATGSTTRVENPPERGQQCRAERVLDQRCRDERRDADQPRLFDAELLAECKPAKSGGENEKVSECHRNEQEDQRSIPSALGEPSRDKGRSDKTKEISGGRTG